MSNVAAMKSSNHFRGGAPQLQGWQVQTEVTGSPSMWADKSFSRPGIFSSALYVTLVYSGSLSSMLKFSHVKFIPGPQSVRRSPPACWLVCSHTKRKVSLQGGFGFEL